VTDALLSVRGLTVEAENGGRPVAIVSDVSFDVAAGETVGVVGETGSGKSMTMLSVMGLLPSPPMRVAAGEVRLDGRDLVSLAEVEMRRIRGADVAMVYQDPMTSLNPVMRIGEQVAEAMTAHGVSAAEARRRTLDALARVGIPAPERTALAYPHEFSGGMRQRAMIAMALALEPRLLIADEPTTALDVTTQQQILTLVKDLRERNRMAIVWVTHDLSVVARLADRVVVMYAGRIVEHGSARRIFRAPEHPYTASLLASLPKPVGAERPPLAQIPGAPPDPGRLPSGCPFHPRCRQARDRCEVDPPPLSGRGDGAAACWVPPREWT
jgi:oligopeptide/dipeptide ABC transporter ATP-binding protein